MDGHERRASARVETDIACIVDGITECRLRNLSVAGGRLLGPLGLADIDDTVSLEISVGDPRPLTVWAEVLRVVTYEAQAEYGVEFVAVEPVEQDKLKRCIELLRSGSPLDRREGSRVYHHVELVCSAMDTLRAVINDISRGGLGVECDAPLVVGESVTVELLGIAGGTPLRLTGTVKHATSRGAAPYLVGLRIEPLPPDQAGRLDELLRLVLRGR